MRLCAALERSRWGLLVAAAALALFCTMYLGTPPAQRPGSDGFYTYLYARSLVFDGDFDFANDYAICGDPHDKNHDRGGGRPENPFYVGPTIYLAPVLWLTRHIVPLPPGAPASVTNACQGPLTKWTLCVAPVMGALTLLIAYLLARRFAEDGPAALATALVGFGAPIAAYATMWPSYSHVYDAFSCALLLLLSVRASERPDSWPRWSAVAVLAGVCYLQRPPTALFGLVPLTFALIGHWRRWRRLLGVLAILGAGLFVVGALPQALLYKYLYGRCWLGGSPHGRYYMHLGHAHPWLSLFGPHGGLFFSSPTTWLAVLGIVPALRIKEARPFVLSGLAATALLVYVSAAALDWDSSSSFGNRRLTCLVGFLVPLAAAWLVRARAWLLMRKARSLVALGLMAVTPVIMVGLGDAMCNAVTTATIERGMSQEELYGLGPATVWKLLDRHVGDLAILPAEIVFKLRYGLPMNAFRDVCEPWFLRDYHSMAMRSNVPPPADGRWTNHVTGLDQTPQGMHMTARRSTLVFAAQWPFANRLDVTLRSQTPVRVAIARGRVWGNVAYGVVEIPGGDQPFATSLPIPEDGFDSGLMELVLASDAAPAASIELLSLEFVDTQAYSDPWR